MQVSEPGPSTCKVEMLQSLNHKGAGIVQYTASCKPRGVLCPSPRDVETMTLVIWSGMCRNSQKAFQSDIMDLDLHGLTGGQLHVFHQLILAPC